MNPITTRSLWIGLALSAWSPAIAASITTSTATAAADCPPPQSCRIELEALADSNKLAAERLTTETTSMREELARLKLGRELLTERQAYDEAKRQAARSEEFAKIEAEKDRLTQEGKLARLRLDKLDNELREAQAQTALELTRMQNEIECIETSKKRAQYADRQPVYLMDPLKDDGVLVVSDRRIALNGLITGSMADSITNRIQYWNNKDRTLPIFIVIDSSPGGSVMAGYRILKAMESSAAPVHVVVKSFAASMAAAITTLATQSYAYPNAVILHHQISSMTLGQLNLTQQRELAQESERWWARLGTPIATKMGITPDELVKKMYSHSSSGDWSEFGEQACHLKWVNHIIQGIDETSVIRDPDSDPAAAKTARAAALAEEIDANGRSFAWLPRLEPKDVYFLYNQDGYYRTR